MGLLGVFEYLTCPRLKDGKQGSDTDVLIQLVTLGGAERPLPGLRRERVHTSMVRGSETETEKLAGRRR